MNKFEYKGFWWLPCKTDDANVYAGSIKYDPKKGTYLDILGDFGQDFNKTIEKNIILGKTENGKKFSLYKCFQKSVYHNSEFGTIKTYYCQYAFKGIYFNSETSIIFKELNYRFSNLDEWTWFNNIKIIPDHDTNEITVKFKPSEDEIISNINNDYSIKIHSLVKTPTLFMVQKEATFIEKSYVKIINKHNKTFLENMTIAHHMQNLLSLLIGEPVNVLEVYGYVENSEPIEIYFLNQKFEENYESVLPPYMLLCLRDIKDMFDSFLKNWFNKVNLIEPIFNLYFSTLYNNHMYLEQRFLNLIQALESYHRRIKNNNDISIEDHKKRIENILNSVNEKYKGWLKSKLSYSNEPSLRKRLNDLINEDCKQLLNLNSKSKKSLINKLCEIRNYYTHYDISLKYKVPNYNDISSLSYKMMALLEYYFFIELGLSNENSKELILRKYKYSNALK